MTWPARRESQSARICGAAVAKMSHAKKQEDEQKKKKRYSARKKRKLRRTASRARAKGRMVGVNGVEF